MKTSAKEKVSYGLGGVGYQMTLALSNAFLTLYYTDSVLISASFVGTMMFIARLMDGLSDIAMGLVIEKTHSRFGKARPWVALGAIPLAISIVLMFNVPASLPALPKNVYVFVTYVFMSVVCYTIVALAHSAMLPRISLDSDDRNKVAVVLGLMQGIFTALLIGLFNPVLNVFGGHSSQNAWTVVSILIAVMSLLLLLVCFLVTKEKLSATEKTEAEEAIPSAGKKTPLKEGLLFLFRGRYFYIILVLYLTMAVTNGTSSIGIYFVRDVLGDANLMGVLSIMSVIPMILMMPFVPKLFKTLGKRRTLLFGLTCQIAALVIMFIFPDVIPVQMAGTFFGTLVIVPLWLAAPTMICDLVDYGDYKRGLRVEGLATSASSFGTKLGMGLGSVIVGIGLTVGGYQAQAAGQTAAARQAIIWVSRGVPTVMCVICLVLVYLWDLEKYKPQVQEYMNKNRL